MESTRAVLEEFYAAEAEYVAAGGPGQADFGRLARCLSRDVVIRQAPGLPWSDAGDWRGHDGVRAFMAAFARTWRSMEVQHHRIVAAEDRVAVELEVRFESAATGRALTTSIVQINTVRDGRIAEIKPYYWEPEAVQRACRTA
jgi:ketosteroid isomerase-like protein